MGETSIQWTDHTWNPTRGCSRVSPGCEHCYAEVIAARFGGPGLPFGGYARRGPQGGRWTGKVSLVEDKLGDPLAWKEPRKVFVNSMSDLFHEKLSNEEIAAVFGVMSACPQHTFQILTKRSARMREWFAWLAAACKERVGSEDWFVQNTAIKLGVKIPLHTVKGTIKSYPWPLENVHLGVSVEDQTRADERVPDLLACPASVRWLSCEPLLEAVHVTGMAGLDWLVVGGESGPGARPMSLTAARSLRDQCGADDVRFFFKQTGAVLARAHGLKDLHGGTFHEYPPEWDDLRVRQFPTPYRSQGAPHV
jgi:protein gp37